MPNLYPTPMTLPSGQNLWFGDSVPAANTSILPCQLGDFLWITTTNPNSPLLYRCTVAPTSAAKDGTWEDPSQSVSFAVISASGAVPTKPSQQYVITKAGVAALTLAAPVATTDDGVAISLISSTLQAHTLTATGLLGTGAAATDLATFAARAGAGLTLVAYQAKWLVQYSVGITFT